MVQKKKKQKVTAAPSEGTAVPPPAVAAEELVTKDNDPRTDLGAGDEGDGDDDGNADDDDKSDDETTCAARAPPRCTYGRTSTAASNARIPMHLLL